MATVINDLTLEPKASPQYSWGVAALHPSHPRT